MKSFALSCLLAAIMLFTNGCKNDDDYNIDLNKTDYRSVVYTANNLIDSNDNVNVDITVEGTKEHLVAFERPRTFTYTGSNKKIDLFYEKPNETGLFGNITVENENIYIYAATTCKFLKDHLLDTVTDTNTTIRIINLTKSDMPSSELGITKNGVSIFPLPNAEKCAVTAMAYTPSTNGTWIVTYAGVEIGRVHITSNASVAIILYDTTDKIAKVIKLEKYDDLIPSCK